MNQEHLAGLLGITQSSVSGWINGKYEPSAATVFLIEQSLGIDPGYLSRPLGYLPVEAAAEPLGVDTAIAESTCIDDQDKAVLVAMYELLASKRDRSATTPSGSKKSPTVAGRRTPASTAKRPSSAVPRPRSVSDRR